jgi:uncharacterized membrane protein (UPF0127 family)
MRRGFPALRLARALVALAWLCGVAVPARAAVSAADAIPLSAFPRETLVVETRAARRHAWEAWRADTSATREQGLMFVPHLEPTQAMFFVYDPPARVSMWMKNTLVPLDMLFVDARGCVVKVERQARPQSLALISAPEPVALVVELAGGTAAGLGIGPGDRVRRPAVGWPVSPTDCSRR